MHTKVSITTIFKCSLERAFKTPMLCDVAKVHTGFIGMMPKVTHCTDDEQWGKPGGSKKIFVAPSLTQKGGWAFTDKVVERIENKYWKIELSEFHIPMFGLTRFVGEWQTTQLEENKINVDYTYTLISNIPLLYPLHWRFAKTFWKLYRKQVTENIREMAYNNEPYIYA
jgi:hypothetical protein